MAGVLQFGIRADLRGNTGVCGSGARTCGACAGTGRTDVYQEGKFLDWGLTDEGVGLLRGEGCEILAQGLTGLIEYSYQQVATSFPEAHLEGTPRLSVLGPEHSKDG